MVANAAYHLIDVMFASVFFNVIVISQDENNTKRWFVCKQERCNFKWKHHKSSCNSATQPFPYHQLHHTLTRVSIDHIPCSELLCAEIVKIRNGFCMRCQVQKRNEGITNMESLPLADAISQDTTGKPFWWTWAFWSSRQDISSHCLLAKNSLVQGCLTWCWWCILYH